MSLLPDALEEGGTMSSKGKQYNTFTHPPSLPTQSPRRRCKTLTRRLYTLALLLITTLAILSTTLTLFSLHILSPPYLAPRKSWSGLRNQTWGIGFSLSAGYATASIAFNNGTILPIATFVDTSPDDGYNNALFRLSLAENAHPSSPYYNRTA